MVDVKEQSSRLYDILLYGATGFTGKRVAQYLYSICQERLLIEGTSIKWAIAGRSQAKLGNVKRSLAGENRDFNSPALPEIFVADLENKSVLVTLFSTAKLVLNVTGPYRFHGAQIVEACLEAECDYMDVCGEPQFMEQCVLSYHETAKQKGVLILHACAFDSVPADLGALFTTRQFLPQLCSSIESFLEIDCPEGLKAHYTTFESAVHGVSDASSLRDIRRQIDAKFKPPAPNYIGPKLERNQSYYFDERVQKWAIPFMGADASVVKSSLRELGGSKERPTIPQYAAYALLYDYSYLVSAMWYGGIFTTLSSFAAGLI